MTAAFPPLHLSTLRLQKDWKGLVQSLLLLLVACRCHGNQTLWSYGPYKLFQPWQHKATNSKAERIPMPGFWPALVRAVEGTVWEGPAGVVAQGGEARRAAKLPDIPEEFLDERVPAALKGSGPRVAKAPGTKTARDSGKRQQTLAESFQTANFANANANVANANASVVKLTDTVNSLLEQNKALVALVTSGAPGESGSGWALAFLACPEQPRGPSREEAA